ncbi:YceI family protein [Cupriavidus sp. AU9028]|uniref:YceI family protein n=1 Tax=Cupriavidus sp. AU9028 TaxID=2871157 RepID=UPI001C95F002|nr:YceI family protein [Cupriavidus sp. AU9028]MBY4897352.1 YceI family protein [Cupriavidus sp. AU9028]
MTLFNAKARNALAVLVAASATIAGAAVAAPVTYNLDPGHTYPSFEADHLGGLSKWRGKINKSSGVVTLDRQAKTGTIDVKMDMSTIDFGHNKMNEHAMSPDIFDVQAHPEATYQGKFTRFSGDVPTEAEGMLTLHGVTRPVKLEIREFKCMQHPMLKREACGADAYATFNRADFGVDYGVKMGFKPEVKLAIQVEGVRAD